MSNLETATQYARDCISGAIPACIYVKQAGERFLSDIVSDKYTYKSTEVDRVVKFISNLDLTEQKTPKKFIPEAWQIFIIANIYGIIRRDNSLRKYRQAYIELARKNGKSQLVTALSMYHLLVDVDAQIIISANSRDQVKNVDFKKVLQFSEQLDRKHKHLVPYYNSIKFKTNELIVTASDPTKLDGLNASFCLIDELHEAPDNRMYNVLKSSQGGRLEPLLMTITTAGFNTESFCYQLRTFCTEILSGEKTDESQFALIYTIDEEDDFADPDTWVKANPNLHISVYANFLESEVNKAVNNVSEKTSVLVKHFNRWLRNNTLDVWINEQLIDSAMSTEIKMSDPMFIDQECIVGIDLASVSDVTSVSYLFHIDGISYFFNSLYLPEDSVNSNQNIQFFKEAGSRGEINITDGNVCDYDLILKDLLKVNEYSPIKKIYYDKFNSTQFIINATEACLQCQPFSQMPGSLNKPLKEFERLLKSDRIAIERNSVVKWMIGNVILDVNKMGNYSIDKRSKSKKIDAVASMMDAFGGMLESPIYSYEIS